MVKKKTNVQIVMKVIDKEFNLILKDIEKITNTSNDMIMRMTACYTALNGAIKLDKED